jgi:hypothetical protein
LQVNSHALDQAERICILINGPLLYRAKEGQAQR